MGDTFSSTHEPEYLEQDPNYYNARNTLKAADKGVQKLVQGCLQQQKRLHDENLKLKDIIQKMQKESKSRPNPKKGLERQMSNSGNPETDKVIEDFLREQCQLTEKNDNLRKENESLKRENQILANEKESALSRLSKIAGIQLTKGNSDIADLGDVNRPTKLAEKWSNLYTDEWTDAYDELGMNKTVKNENFKFEKELCSITVKCYSICLDIERKQMKDIKSHTWDIACCLHQQPDQLVSAAKTTQYERVVSGDLARKAATMTPQDAKSGKQSIMKMLAMQKCMEELIQIVHERRKYDKQLLLYVKQEAVRHFDKYNTSKSGSKGQIIRFVEHCTELCWSMVIKNPQMVLIHSQMEGKPFDRDMFSIYTKKGTIIELVVWPALILHQNGPTLAKGTVQCKDVKSEIEQAKTDTSKALKEGITDTSKALNEGITDRSIKEGNSSIMQGDVQGGNSRIDTGGLSLRIQGSGQVGSSPVMRKSAPGGNPSMMQGSVHGGNSSLMQNSVQGDNSSMSQTFIVHTESDGKTSLSGNGKNNRSEQ